MYICMLKYGLTFRPQGLQFSHTVYSFADSSSTFPPSPRYSRPEPLSHTLKIPNRRAAKVQDLRHQDKNVSSYAGAHSYVRVR